MGGGKAAFLTPGTVFLSTSIAAEFKPLKVVAANALSKGYERFVEPAAGGFAMCHVAAQIGWDPKMIESSDIIFFSSAMGAGINDERIDHLNVETDGLEIDSGDPAEAIWAMTLLRAEARAAKTFYWAEIARSFREDKDRHVEKIRKDFRRGGQILGGMKYTSEDMFEHLERVVDDPKTLIFLNPPSTTGGFEKFYETDGKFRWKEPSYEVFEVAAGYRRLTDMFSSSKALMSVYMENQKGHVIEGAVMARGGGRKAPGDTFAKSINYYVCSNRPDEFGELGGGLMVQGWEGSGMNPLPVEMLPKEHVLSEDSTVQVVKIKNDEAQYYRSLWTHNFVGTQAPHSLALIVDGYLVGVFGYDPMYLSSMGQFGGESEHCLLSYGMTVPRKLSREDQRLSRLLGRVALCRDSLRIFLNPIELYRCKKVRTAQITKHAESKETRGIMKMTNRKKDPAGYRLIYEAEVREQNWKEVLVEWLKDEQRWWEKRKAAKSSAS
jgi:hypothetical protein